MTTAAVIVSIVFPFVIRCSGLIARDAITIIALHVFAFIVGSACRVVVIVIVGTCFFLGVCIINQRFRVGFGSEDMRRLRSARDSKNSSVIGRAGEEEIFS